VGAHWLHQAVLFAMDGYEVTAIDLPETMDIESVRSIARAHRIQLASYESLACPAALAQFADGRFDVIVFAEVLEHIAFNPVPMWREIYRLLAEGGMIVVTTPNCYAATRRRLHELRYWAGGGAGITVDEILATPTGGHHWKEYSMRELIRYFERLSPDFIVERAMYVEDELAPGASAAQKLSARIRRRVPVLRSRLHVEVLLPAKRHGIAVEPHWS
jgi:2-polyprenyl-3-methyl-5-hydroxy-6-metoxy-1,4-benzoquinol methylase